MKKITVLLLILPLLLCACSHKRDEDTGTVQPSYIDADPSDVIDRVYGMLSDGTATSDYIPQLITEKITEKNDEYYLGISGIPYTKGAASEAYIQPVTFSFCVIVLEEGADYDSCRKTIEQNLNRSKWVCAAASEAIAVRHANVIAVIMGTKKVCAELEGAFLDVISK